MENTETPVSMKETKLEWFKKTFTKSVSGFKIIRTAVTVGVVGYLGYTYIVQRLKKKLVSSIHNETILRWNYDDIHISESKASSDSILDFAVNDPSHLSFRELLETLSMAEEDPRIQGLIINFGKTSNKNEDSSPLGLAQIQEVREKILHLSKVKRIEFGDKSKFIAYTDDFTDQRKYYLATAFDQIQVGPLAQIPFYGLGARSMFYKGTLEKLGLNFNASTREAHKGVYASLTSTEYPNAIKQNISQLLKSIDKKMVADMIEARSLKLDLSAISLLSGTNVVCPVNAIKTLQDIAPLSSLDALGSGLIDEISLKSNNFLTSLVSIEKLVSTTPKIIDLLDKFNQFVDSESVQVKDINTYYTTCQAIRKRANVTTTPLLRLNKVMKKEGTEIESFVRKNMTIGIIHLSGNMMRGNGTFGSTAISNAFMTAGADESIDAIVFRIDTGGGDARAAENIWQSIRHVQDTYKKPIIASFGNVCASGGYYVAAPCDFVYASHGTITGSIGVASAKPFILPKLLDAIGVTVDEISFSNGYRNTSSFKDLDSKARVRFEKHLDETYDLFLGKVVSGRQIEYKDLKENIAGGRVWSGEDALELGLVNQLGGLEEALKMAAEYGRKDKNFSSDRVYLKEFPKKKSFIEAIQSLDGGVKSQIGDIALIMMKRFFKSQISNRDQEFMTEFDPRNIE